jgi:hypothetical protein
MPWAVAGITGVSYLAWLLSFLIVFFLKFLFFPNYMPQSLTLPTFETL